MDGITVVKDIEGMLIPYDKYGRPFSIQALEGFIFVLQATREIAIEFGSLEAMVAHRALDRAIEIVSQSRVVIPTKKSDIYVSGSSVYLMNAQGKMSEDIIAVGSTSNLIATRRRLENEIGTETQVMAFVKTMSCEELESNLQILLQRSRYIDDELTGEWFLAEPVKKLFDFIVSEASAFEGQ